MNVRRIVRCKRRLRVLALDQLLNDGDRLIRRENEARSEQLGQ
jgi:hypothetical protein